MKRRNKILLLLLCIFIAIQFIKPARNKGGQVLFSDIENIYTVPNSVLSILKNSCYDCHSNNTKYPWYSAIQPGAWFMAWHIKDGKEQLNFNEFGTCSKRKQQSKLKEMRNKISDGSMPLRSYTLIHENAKLSENDKIILLSWIDKTKDSLSLKN